MSWSYAVIGIERRARFWLGVRCVAVGFFLGCLFCSYYAKG